MGFEEPSIVSANYSAGMHGGHGITRIPTFLLMLDDFSELYVANDSASLSCNADTTSRTHPR